MNASKLMGNRQSTPLYTWPMRVFYEVAAILGISGCYLYFHHKAWVRHLVRFAASHDLDERDRHYRRWNFIAALGIIPSCSALMASVFLINGILPKARPDIYVYGTLFAWVVSVTPTMVFIFRHAGSELRELGYPGHRKNIVSNAK
jgi:hypothetical protein